MTTETLERDIVEIGEAADATALYTDEAQFENLLASIKAAIGEGPFDMNVKADREHLRSAAAKIAKVKTRVDAGGAELKSEAQKRVDEINGYRRRYKEALQALQDDTRMPLTDWEQAEKARQERVASILNELKEVRYNPAPFGATVEAITDRLAEVEAQALDADTFGDQLGYAEKVKAEAIKVLTNAAERIRREEAERAELEALRKEKAARAAEAEERRKREAVEAEARAKRMAEKAAEKARVEERQRIEREQREKAEREAAEAKEAERQARNKKHRREVETAAAGALAAQVDGLSEEDAAVIIGVIADKRIPRVAIQY